MPLIGAKQSRFGPRQLTGWERFEAWRDKRKAMAQQYLDESAVFAANFSSVFINDVAGQAKLATQAAVKRMQAETRAKLDQAAKLSIDKTA